MSERAKGAAKTKAAAAEKAPATAKAPSAIQPDGPEQADRAELILDRLESHDGWHSGQELSRALGVSRAAIAKRVAVLRDLGHAIDSAPRRGYKLLAKADPLSRELVEEHLTTRFIGRTDWLILAETGSTNSVAAELAAKGAPEGAIVAAERQTLGRGRKADNWFSAPRALQFSILLRPKLPAGDLDWLTPAGVLSLAEAISLATSARPLAKKPNDVLIGKRKVGGILSEAGLRGGAPDWAVLGIGCNVNALAGDFPLELRGIATSLLMETQTPASRAKLLALTLNQVEFWYEKLLSGDLESLKNKWGPQNA